MLHAPGNQRTEPKVVADKNHALRGQLLTVGDDSTEDSGPLTRKLVIAASGQPHHHSQRVIGFLLRPPDIDVKAVFVALDLVGDDLRAHLTIVAAVAHAIPAGRRNRRLPSQFPDGRPGIGDPLEGERLPFSDTAHCALLGAEALGDARRSTSIHELIPQEGCSPDKVGSPCAGIRRAESEGTLLD